MVKLKDESQDELNFPPPDYDKRNPVFVDDTDEPEVKYQVHGRNNDRDNDSHEVKYRGIDTDNISNEIKYQTPPYDTYGYSRHASPTRYVLKSSLRCCASKKQETGRGGSHGTIFGTHVR